MGTSWSNGRRRTNTYHHHPPPPPPPQQPPYYYPAEPFSLPLPPPPQPTTNLNYCGPTPGAATRIPPPPAAAASSSYPAPHNPYLVHPYYNSHPYSSCSYSNNVMGRFNYQPFYYPNQPNGWPAVRPNVGPVAQPTEPAPYVEHQDAKKVRNDVNVHKDTLKLEIDEQNPDHVLVSFEFDALFDGSITIFYFAKEETNCRFVPAFPEAHLPVRVPFLKGIGQKFCQPSGTGIDLGFFELNDLAKPSPGEDVFPLVVVAGTCVPVHTEEDECGTNTSQHMQITQAVLEKKNNDPFQVRVVKQILWVDGVRYELRELYGAGSSTAEGFNDSDQGKECVICMTDPKDTAVLPCRHMCMCSECAKELRIQSDKCPICRQPIESLLEIKIVNRNQ